MNSNVFRSMVVMSGLTTAVEFSAILASSGSSHPWKHSPKQTKQELLDKITLKSSSTFLALGYTITSYSHFLQHTYKLPNA